MNTKIKAVAAIACGVVACGLSQSAHANLVSDAGFNTDSLGQIGFNTTASPWVASGDDQHSYDFILNGTGNSVGVSGNVAMYGPLPASGDGGNYLGIDPVYTPHTGNTTSGVNSISQTISGLQIGSTYTLSFYWAAAQQQNYVGNTTEGWNFGLGDTAHSVSGSDLSQSFGGWKTDSITVTATATSEVLTFVAEGGPNSGNPPFDLLDGVSLTKNVPDSSSTAGLMGLGVAAMGIAAGFRRFVRA
jgi:hypothetical protein